MKPAISRATSAETVRRLRLLMTTPTASAPASSATRADSIVERPQILTYIESSA